MLVFQYLNNIFLKKDEGKCFIRNKIIFKLYSVILVIIISVHIKISKFSEIAWLKGHKQRVKVVNNYWMRFM